MECLLLFVEGGKVIMKRHQPSASFCRGQALCSAPSPRGSGRAQATVCAGIVLAMTAWSGARAEPAEVPTPSVTLAPDAGAMFNASRIDLAKHGISEREFFFSGNVASGQYKSRMIVRRPAEARRFNGTVIVEWMNASSGNDIDVDFLSILPLVEQEGYAYVAVTSQAVAVDFLRGQNTARYGTLQLTDSAPEQSAAFEVFSQAGKALLDQRTSADLLDGLQAIRLIAIGQSQSSARLTAMINKIHGLRLAPIYAAYIPHSGGAAPLRFPVPVLKLSSENEAPTYFGYRAVADVKYRYWEVPGTAHQPNAGNAYAHELLAQARGSFPNCPFPYDGPGGPVPMDPILRAAIAQVDVWLRTGVAPAVAPLIDMIADPKNPTNGLIQRDSFGNALGGIRMPQQEVPTGRNTPSFACVVSLPGSPAKTSLATFPQWDAFNGGIDPTVDPTDTVNAIEPTSARALYGDHERYVQKFAAATSVVQAGGFILASDARNLITEAAQSNVAK